MCAIVNPLTISSNTPPAAARSVLNSWKEIAHYLDRGVRTVQRWERELQLPVHRIGKGKRSPVYAVVAELKFWMVTSAGRDAMLADRPRNVLVQPGVRERQPVLAVRLHELAQAVAQASVRHQRQAEALQKNIVALRSQFARRRAK
jgi:hypothetical protein